MSLKLVPPAGRPRRRLWYLAATAVLLAVAWKYHVGRRLIIASSALIDCDGCRATKRIRDTGSAFMMNPELAERFAASPTMTGGRTPFYYEFPTVGVLLFDRKLHCTGTLVAPKVVLTAAHCVAGVDRSHLLFGFGQDIAIAARHSYTIADVQYPTGFPDVRFRYDPATYADDVALLYLHKAPGTRMSRLSTTQPAFPTTLEFVGYGFDLMGNSGSRSTASLLTTELNIRRIKHGDAVRSVCTGDSGGPAFDRQDAVLAVTSTTTGCVGGESTLVPALYEWLDPRVPDW